MGRNRHDRAVAPHNALKSRGFARRRSATLARLLCGGRDGGHCGRASRAPCALAAAASSASRRSASAPASHSRRAAARADRLAQRAATRAHCIADSRKRGLRAWEHRCEKCGVVFYCSADCAAAARAHRARCAAMAHADRAGIDDEDIDFVMQAIRIVDDAATLYDGRWARRRRRPRPLVRRAPRRRDASGREGRDALGRIVAATLRRCRAAQWAPAALLDVLERSWCNLRGVGCRRRGRRVRVVRRLLPPAQPRAAQRRLRRRAPRRAGDARRRRALLRLARFGGHRRGRRAVHLVHELRRRAGAAARAPAGALRLRLRLRALRRRRDGGARLSRSLDALRCASTAAAAG